MALLSQLNKIRKRTIKNNGYFYLAIILLVVGGCSVGEQHKISTFFFDGVPDFVDYSEMSVNDSLTLADSLAAVDVIVNEQQTTVLKSNTHPPYLNNKCVSCHNMEKMYSKTRGLKDPQSETCYGCHNDFRELYASLHAPVASGNCTTCHNPHMSKNKKLLKIIDRELCFNCHSETRVLTNKFHTTIEEANCIECHDPHGGKGAGNSASLKPGVCVSCHQDLTNNYTFLHGPLNTGECTACHGQHSLKTSKNLIRKGQETCFYCHNSADVLSNKNHLDVNTNNCVKCHNPHGEENRRFVRGIKQEARKKPLNVPIVDTVGINTPVIDKKEEENTPEEIVVDAISEDSSITNQEEPIVDTINTSTLVVDKEEIVSDNTSADTPIDQRMDGNFELGKSYAFRKVFSFGEVAITPEAQLIFDDLLELIETFPNPRIEISGHTDGYRDVESWKKIFKDEGIEYTKEAHDKRSATLNQELSEKRAKAVVDYMISKGAKKEWFIAVGYGESKSLAPNINPDGSDNVEGRNLNRRIEFKLLTKDEKKQDKKGKKDKKKKKRKQKN